MIVFTFGPQAAAKGVKISLENDFSLSLPGEDSTVMKKKKQSHFEIPKLIGDERRLKQVLMNLVRNALKFTSSGSVKIKVCYRPEPENLLVIHVKDTGAGIAREDFDKLFTRFGKLKRTAAMNSDGIGLGLTMVKQIAESSGGAVDVQSEGIGKGSVFRVSMQIA